MEDIQEGGSVVSGYIELQAKLLEAFNKKFSELSDFVLMTDFPRKGVLMLGDEDWQFLQHGVGVLFKSTRSGCVVDVHANFLKSNYVDKWRLIQYFESLGLNEKCVQKTLEDLVKAGVLFPDKTGYEMAKD